MSLSDDDRLKWLQLIRSDNVGPITFAKLLETYGTADRALKALPELAKKGGKRALKIASPDAVQEEAERIEAFGARLIALPDPDYPNLLRAIDDPPPVIAAKGALHLLAKPMVAIVGARDASGPARTLAHQLAHELGEAGLCVVSGMARGIDRAAHVGALSTGTVAVMAGGLDKLYPRENEDLYERLLSEGVLVSETEMGVTPQARHFPKRNRIVSGMALGTIIVEATERSGSLITARMAREQNREVMAVPGSPLEARAKGPNALIRDGATLISSAQDVLHALDPFLRQPLREPPHSYREKTTAPPAPDESELAPFRPKVLEALSPTAIERDTLARLIDCPAPVLSVLLLELELAGKIEQAPGNRVCLKAQGSELPI